MLPKTPNSIRKKLHAKKGHFRASFSHRVVEEKIDKWVRMVEKLAEVARVQPHAAYTSFVAGLSH